MKKQLLSIGLLVCSCIAYQPVQAQSLDKANTEYKNFVRLNNENADKGTLYVTLYDCYKEYVAVLKSAAPAAPPTSRPKARCATSIRIFRTEPSTIRRREASKTHC